MSPIVKSLVRPPGLGWIQPPGAERGPRARTHRRLLAEAMALVQRGRIPSVPEVAAKARVSRATAYRYFPSRSALVTAVVGEALAPVRDPEILQHLRDVVLASYLRDTDRAWVLDAAGGYSKPEATGAGGFNAQEFLLRHYTEAVTE